IVFKRYEPILRLYAVIKTPEELVFQAFGIFETLGSKISHGTSKKFAGVRYHLSKVSSKSFCPQSKALATRLFLVEKYPENK
ncbi:MAG: hypothetical protein UFE77_02440, partial [Streptococcus salivarius]|nr:hypothetical protein [Streptococcus salivarius]